MRKPASGVLIVEAVIASFLMVFAFLASASLYEAALRWESQGSNMRRAALVAEQKIEQLRAAASQVPGGTTFADHLDSLIAGPHAPIEGYPITVTSLPNHHETVATSGYTPPDGFYSPCSTLYTQPDNPGSTSRVNPPYNFDSGTATDPAPRGAGDFQKNNLYETYPYSRDMSRSYRLVKVEVDYGARNGQPLELISVIGDPILPLENTTPNLNVSMTVNPGGTVNIGSGFQDFTFTLVTDNGSIVEDASCIWNIHPLSGGTAELFVRDAKGSEVRVSRSPLSRPGTDLRLFPKVRYRGVDVRATSGEVNL